MNRRPPHTPAHRPTLSMGANWKFRPRMDKLLGITDKDFLNMSTDNRLILCGREALTVDDWKEVLHFALTKMIELNKTDLPSARDTFLLQNIDAYLSNLTIATKRINPELELTPSQQRNWGKEVIAAFYEFFLEVRGSVDVQQGTPDQLSYTLLWTADRLGEEIASRTGGRS